MDIAPMMFGSTYRNFAARVFGWLEKRDATAVTYVVTSGITMLSLGAVGYWSWRRHLIRRKRLA